MSDHNASAPAQSLAKVVIRVPPNLRSVTNGRDEVQIAGRTVREIISALEWEFPGLRTRILDEEGRVRRFVLLVLNDDILDPEEDLDSPVREGDQISILPALAGG
ncbi:MoaD/ThiS family protein [Verrucomicrobiota bacterium sgz303538]